MTAVSYLRRSSNARANSLDVSFDAQRDAIDSLAKRHGDAIAHEYSDSGKSGGSTNGRHGYKAMLDAIEAGAVSAVYSYAITRLTRSQRDAIDLWDLCKAHGVTIRTADGMDSSTTAGMMQFDLLALTAKWEREWAVERVRGAMAARKAKGHKVGSAGYGAKLRGGKAERDDDEDLAAVMAAWGHSANSFAKTARILNERGVRPRWAKRWSGRAVSRIVRRELGEANVPRVKAGPIPKRQHVLSGLVRCGACGGLMTTKVTRAKGKEYLSLLCGNARYLTEAQHPRPYIFPMRRFVPAVRAEADHLTVPYDVLEDIADDKGERAAIEGRLERVKEMREMGDLTKDQYIAKRDALRAELDRLEMRMARHSIPPDIDWGGDPAAINRVLRTVFERIDLTPDNQKVKRFVWAVPEWRAP